jgi:hypothetical protein
MSLSMREVEEFRSVPGDVFEAALRKEIL